MTDKEKIKNLHPCFGKTPNKGRIHLPVCPTCNISCNFCDRKINDYDNRPGVASFIIEPDDAVNLIDRAIAACPDITVVGIAGPGDTLADDNALRTFRLVKERFPGLLKCMSTNGLLLKDRAEELIDIGIDTLTVTVNAVDPQILSDIVSEIVYKEITYKGKAAATILIENQLAGIEKLAKSGITIKVNTVLIHEINSGHISEIAKQVQEAGASIYNIIPLIPQHKLAHCKEPACIDIDSARREAEQYIEVFRHCQRCRADAVGIPGQLEVGEQVYGRQLILRETFSHG